MAFSDVVPVDANDGVPLAPTYLHPGMARPPLMEDLLEEGWWPILPSSVTIRRWVFDRVGGFAEEYKGAAGFEDTELWFLLRELGDFAFVPEPLVNYRLAPIVERMRKYAPGFGLFAARMRKRYGEPGDKLARRCAALYHWLLTVKGLRCLEAGDMREARRALFCALRYQPSLWRPDLRHQLRAIFENGRAASSNGNVPAVDARRRTQGMVCAFAASRGARSDAPQGIARDSARASQPCRLRRRTARRRRAARALLTHRAMNQRNCLILGSGRSGTSMAAGILARAGYFMGEELWPADIGNPKGYFEDREVNKINDELIAPVAPKTPPHGLRKLLLGDIPGAR